jgi:hypothetical protein
MGPHTQVIFVPLTSVISVMSAFKVALSPPMACFVYSHDRPFACYLGLLPVATPLRGGVPLAFAHRVISILALGPETEVCGPEPFPSMGAHRRSHRDRRSPCGDAKACCAGVGWGRPSGGFEVWLCLPSGLQSVNLRPVPQPLPQLEPTGIGACLLRAPIRASTGTRARKTAY